MPAHNHNWKRTLLSIPSPPPDGSDIDDGGDDLDWHANGGFISFNSRDNDLLAELDLSRREDTAIIPKAPFTVAAKGLSARAPRQSEGNKSLVRRNIATAEDLFRAVPEQRKEAVGFFSRNKDSNHWRDHSGWFDGHGKPISNTNKFKVPEGSLSKGITTQINTQSTQLFKPVRRSAPEVTAAQPTAKKHRATAKRKTDDGPAITEKKTSNAPPDDGKFHVFQSPIVAALRRQSTIPLQQKKRPVPKPKAAISTPIALKSTLDIDLLVSGGRNRNTEKERRLDSAVSTPCSAKPEETPMGMQKSTVSSSPRGLVTTPTARPSAKRTAGLSQWAAKWVFSPSNASNFNGSPDLDRASNVSKKPSGNGLLSRAKPFAGPSALLWTQEGALLTPPHSSESPAGNSSAIEFRSSPSPPPSLPPLPLSQYQQPAHDLYPMTQGSQHQYRQTQSPSPFDLLPHNNLPHWSHNMPHHHRSDLSDEFQLLFDTTHEDLFPEQNLHNAVPMEAVYDDGAYDRPRARAAYDPQSAQYGPHLAKFVELGVPVLEQAAPRWLSQLTAARPAPPPRQSRAPHRSPLPLRRGSYAGAGPGSDDEWSTLPPHGRRLTLRPPVRSNPKPPKRSSTFRLPGLVSRTKTQYASPPPPLGRPASKITFWAPTPLSQSSALARSTSAAAGPSSRGLAAADGYGPQGMRVLQHVRSAAMARAGPTSGKLMSVEEDEGGEDD